MTPELTYTVILLIAHMLIQATASDLSKSIRWAPRILNPQQSGILGMHKIQDHHLGLNYDHRIVDGKGEVTFLARVKEALENPRRLLMDL